MSLQSTLSEKALSKKHTSTRKIFYWTTTLSFCALMLAAVVFMLSQNETAQNLFLSLGYPATLVYPLAFLKIAGVIAIITHQSKLLSEWAYAGFFFVSVFALAAHIEAGVGQAYPALLAIVLIMMSYYASKSIKP